MRYLNDDDPGVAGDPLGELHEGPDGRLYEWVDGVDAWGGEVGFWQGVSEPPPLDGIGALYEAPDGSLYQVQGFGEEAAAEEGEAAAEGGGDAPGASSQSDAGEKPPKMGPGRPGEIRTGPDGRRYRWVRGVGAAGRPVGFWRRIRPRPGPARPPVAAARRGVRAPARPGAAPGRKRKPFLKRLLPLAKVAASLIPVPGAGQLVKAGLTVADKALTRRRSVAGLGEVGALYAAPDGTLYQVQGFDADEQSVQGLYDAPSEIADDQNVGDYGAYGADPTPLEDAPSFTPLQDGDAMDGYVRDDGRRVDGFDGYVRDPQETRQITSAREMPEAWKPLW
jgi:hypothetical protein